MSQVVVWWMFVSVVCCVWLWVVRCSLLVAQYVLVFGDCCLVCAVCCVLCGLLCVGLFGLLSLYDVCCLCVLLDSACCVGLSALALFEWCAFGGVVCCVLRLCCVVVVCVV